MNKYKTFINNSESGFAGQINLFCINIGEYISLLGLDEVRIDKLKTANIVVQFIFEANHHAQTYAVAFNSY